MALEGTVFGGKYRIVRQIGAGGMGRVFEAVHEQTERSVAVKVLTPEAAQHPDTRARFDREARAAGRIGHDNICEVIDVGFADGDVPYLVMPLLRGRPLSAVLREDGPLSLRRAIDVASQILAALAAAHAAGVIHRDLKPDNVFLVRMGDREDFVKVLDFGISKIIGEKRPDATLTQTGTILGTPYYMSPEQARGLKDLDQRVDVYAMGAILYQLLTGRPPFDGESYNQLLSAILLDDFPKPSVLRPEIPPAIEDVILRATEKDRDKRFREAGEMRRALLSAVTGTSLRPPEVAATLASSETLPSIPTPMRTPGTPLPGAGWATTPTPAQAGPAVAVPTPGPGLRPAPPVPAGPASGPASSPDLSASRSGQVVLAETGGGRRPSRAFGFAVAGIAVVAAAALAVFLVGRAERQAGAGDGAASRTSKNVPTAGSGTAGVQAVAPIPPSFGGTPLPPPFAPPPPPPRQPALPPPAADAGGTVDAAGPSPDVGPSVGSAGVRITLAGVPDGAEIREDGELRDGPVLELPRLKGETLIEISAHGYKPWSQRVVLDGDKTVEVRMQRTGGTGRPSDAATASSDAGGGSFPPFGEGP